MSAVSELAVCRSRIPAREAAIGAPLAPGNDAPPALVLPGW